MPSSPLLVVVIVAAVLCGWTERAAAFCPSQCQCNDHALETNCINARLDVVPILLNPALRSLKLAHNRISTIRQSLDFYADLEVLDLSHNALTTVGQRHLEWQKMLSSLNLSYNSISRLEGQSFMGLGHLQQLDLQHNQLTSLEDDTLSQLEELTDLDLSFNSIERLSAGCFSSLYRLRSLNLNSNRLQLVPSTSLQPLTGLLSLDLSRNLIAQLDGAAFGWLVELRDLNLSNNTLHHIHFAAFEGLGQALVLDLSSNRLETVPTSALAPLGRSLLSLDLSGNYMSDIGAHSFASLEQLESLRLSAVSSLQAVHPQALSSLNGSLQTLILSDNRRWSTLDPQLIGALTHLRYVDLSGNGLQTVAPVDWPPHLEYFDLSGNPLQCNCSMHWLWQNHLRGSNHRNHNNNRSSVPMKDILCHGPAHLEGQHFFQLDESHLTCFSAAYILLISVVVGLVLTVGAALVVLCCWRRQRLDHHAASNIHHHHHHHVKHLANNMLQQSNHPESSPPFKSKTMSLPKTVDYFLNDDDYVYHPGGHIKPIPVTAV